VELEATVHEGGEGWGSGGGGFLPKQRKWREGGCVRPWRALEEEVGPRRRVMWWGFRRRHNARGEAGGGRRAVVAQTGEAEGGVRSGGPHVEERGGRMGRAWNTWAGRAEGKRVGPEETV
jgi:hypothetical protein